MSDTPTAVALNLDDLEREGTPGEFPIIMGGERIVMTDAQEIDWQALMVAMQSPHAFFRLVVPADKQEAFFGAALPTWKMRRLMDTYSKHYGLLDQGNPGALPR